MLRLACIFCVYYGSELYNVPEVLDDKGSISFCSDSVNDFEQVIVTCAELYPLIKWRSSF